MPHTKTETVFYFDELDEHAKDRARDWYRKGHLDYEWWNLVFDDAERIGLKITEFDLGGRKQIKGHLTVSVRECYRRILREHGTECDTYHLADSWQAQSDKLAHLRAAQWDDEAEEERNKLEAEQDAHRAEFEQALLEEYFSLLDKEYDYLNSNESIDESLRSNQYTFDSTGSIA